MPTVSLDDAGVASSIEGSLEASGEVSQDLLDHISDAFAGKTDLEGPGEETVSVPPAEVARRAAVKQEQTDELVQEELESADGNEPEKASPEDAEGEADAAAEEQPVAEPIPSLDPNLRFVAQHYGWTDEQIDKLHEANPELATQTFENFLTAFTAMSRQGGLFPTQSPQQSPPAAQTPQAQVSKIDQIVKNLKEFSELNGEPLGDFVKALHEEVISPFRQMQAELAVQRQQAVATEATLVTQSLAEKFPDVYGKGEAEKLNLIQQTNRQKLYEVADQIRAGAYQQGKNLSVKDALSRSHLIITADKREQAGRQQVQQQVQRRAKQITARPTQRGKASASVKGAVTAAEAYAQRATELGIDVGE